ncbi:hypothetical protein ABIA00_003363 [Bradyrhizobium ottawaense]
MSDRRHAKLGIFPLTCAQRNETHIRAQQRPPMIKHFGADRPPLQPQKRWNWELLVALLINAVLWAGIYWVITAFF